MTRINRLMLAAAPAALLASGALAATPAPIYGGGSTLAFPTDIAEFHSYKNGFVDFGSESADFMTPLYYSSIGSGAGTLDFLANNFNATPYPASLASTQTIGGNSVLAFSLVAIDGKTPAYYNATTKAVVGTKAPTVFYGTSDALLAPSYSYTDSTGKAHTIALTGTAPNYKNTYAIDGVVSSSGPLIQVPAFAVPVTIPFRGIKSLANTNGALQLKDADLCTIFSGGIDAVTGPVKVVYRADGSGTTFLLTTHLASVCTTKTAGGAAFFKPTTSFASLFTGQTPPVAVPSNFIAATGSGGVQSAIAGGTSVIGYVGPDYTAIAPKAGKYNANVPVAAVFNTTTGAYYLPTNGTDAATDNLTPAFASGPTAPSGTAGSGGTNDPANPINWGPTVANPKAGYPVVGYTFFLLSQCYATHNAVTGPNIAAGISQFLAQYYNNTSSAAGFTAVAKNNGFDTIPNVASNTYLTAINNDFLKSTSSLGIGNATACSGKGR